jgi:hypothetical protein
MMRRHAALLDATDSDLFTWNARSSYRQGHRPLLSYTPFTGTIVLCAVPDCDEQFGA